jgi:CelD/BcsL family acetyltransferase involved in cellulose biosynthesis
MAGLTNAYEADTAPTFTPRGDTDLARSVHDRGPTEHHTSVPELRFSIIRSRLAFEALEPQWNDLFERCGKPHQLFQTFNWNWQWAQAFLGADDAPERVSPIAVLVGYQGDRLVTLWPMVLERRGALTELCWMGEPVSQYGDVLIDAGVGDTLGVLRASWVHLTSCLQPDLARLRKVRADAAVFQLLEDLGAKRTAELEAPYIDLTKADDFASYETRFPNRALRNRRRQMRRLEDTGRVSFKTLEEGSEASACASHAIELKRQWLIDRGYVSPALADARMATFMAQAAAGGRHSTSTRVGVLRSGDATAALQISFTCKNTRVFHVIVYDRSFEKMAAGVLHLEDSIRQGFAEGLDRIDLLAPAADYKLDWADGRVPVIDFAIGHTLMGRVYASIYLGYVRGRMKSAVERMPHRVRTFLVQAHLRSAAKRFMTALGLA